MIKKVFLYFFSIFVLVGCSDYSKSESSDKKVVSIKASEQNDSPSDREKIKLNDFNKVNFSPFDTVSDEYKLPDFELENAECRVFGPIDLKKSEKITLTFQLQSNDSINHMSIGVIKDFIPNSESNFEIEVIYSESIDNELKVTYTAPVDSHYSISILGTMAGNVVVKNGKIIKH